ncbi:hypothetical protein [Thalassobaculum salexigens]|uniref:hypothetical protein n=1 Tax=Thalassobaculum salexigens TaxID=455360 RepID=UPI00248ED491|nr:hypothetical protein [Thalassobaculum salexigens]
MKHGLRKLRRIVLVCICGAFLISAVRPDLGHLPNLLDVLSEHAETAHDHGHSHGLEEDIFTALQGHAHGLGDHEHVPDLLPVANVGPMPQTFGGYRSARLSDASPTPIFLFERPPRS